MRIERKTGIGVTQLLIFMQVIYILHIFLILKSPIIIFDNFRCLQSNHVPILMYLHVTLTIIIITIQATKIVQVAIRKYASSCKKYHTYSLSLSYIYILMKNNLNNKVNLSYFLYFVLYFNFYILSITTSKYIKIGVKTYFIITVNTNLSPNSCSNYSKITICQNTLNEYQSNSN